MSARGFRSVGWVAGIAATALGCYMVNLKVAAERAALEDVETRIVIAQRDIRLLQTEIGTRGRLAQLEKWNVKVLALSAPQANQFMEGSFQLATLMRPDKKIDPAAPVVLASAPAPQRSAPVMDSDGATAQQSTAGPSAADLMHVVSLKVREPKPQPADEPQKKAVEKPAKPSVATARPPAKTAKPVGESKLAGKETPPKPKPKPDLASATKPKLKEANSKQ